MAFAAAATKDTANAAPGGGSGDASRLVDDWRSRIPRDLAALAAAWRDPEAWTGMTRAGGIDLPGEIAGVVALDELVVHGWDVARASRQPYDVDEPSLAAVHGFVEAVLRTGRGSRRDLRPGRRGAGRRAAPRPDHRPRRSRPELVAGLSYSRSSCRRSAGCTGSDARPCSAHCRARTASRPTCRDCPRPPGRRRRSSRPRRACRPDHRGARGPRP